MSSHLPRTLLIVVMFVSCGTAELVAGKFNRKLSAGDAAPVWKDLPGVDGKIHSLADLKEAKAVVVIFTCNHCPVASGYKERFLQFVKDYQARDVTLIAISCSRLPADSLEKMKLRSKESNFNFAYLQDLSQQSAKEYGATVTPQAFVLDGERKVAYLGAFDDSMDSKKVETHYVRDAVDAVLAGRKVEIKESRPFGCGIQYE